MWLPFPCSTKPLSLSLLCPPHVTASPQLHQPLPPAFNQNQARPNSVIVFQGLQPCIWLLPTGLTVEKSCAAITVTSSTTVSHASNSTHCLKAPAMPACLLASLLQLVLSEFLQNYYLNKQQPEQYMKKELETVSVSQYCLCVPRIHKTQLELACCSFFVKMVSLCILFLCTSSQLMSLQVVKMHLKRQKENKTT